MQWCIIKINDTTCRWFWWCITALHDFVWLSLSRQFVIRSEVKPELTNRDSPAHTFSRASLRKYLLYFRSVISYSIRGAKGIVDNLDSCFTYAWVILFYTQVGNFVYVRQKKIKLTHSTVFSGKTCIANTLIVVLIVNRSTERSSMMLTRVVHARCLWKDTMKLSQNCKNVCY